MGTVTLTVEQLQDLLQAQTSQLENHFSSQMAALQSDLEQSFEQKLQAKFDQAELNVKQFMKESMEEEDPEEMVESTKQATEDLQFLKDHVLQMEQNVNRIFSPDPHPLPVPPEDQEMDMDANSNVHTPQGKLSSIPSSAPAQRSSSAPTPSSTETMEQMVTECCSRLEQLVQDRTANWAANSTTEPPPHATPRRSRSDSIPASTSGGTVSALRATQQFVEDILERRLGNLELFIDSRHAELEAFQGSAMDAIKSLIEESQLPPGSKGDNNDENKVPLTLEALEAALDARISEEAEHHPITKDELEAVLDARISAEEQAEEEEKEERQTDRNSRNTQEPAESYQGSKSLHLAMERLIQQQQEWISLQSSTRDLEQEVQLKLEQLEHQGGGKTSEMQRVEAKLESLEKLVLVAIANSASKKKQRSSSKKSTKQLSQLIMNHPNNNNDNEGAVSTNNKARRLDDGSSNANAMTNASLSTPIASNSAYGDISVDERGIEDDDDEEETKEPSEEGDHVQSFMNTLSKFKQLNKQQEDVRDHHRSGGGEAEPSDIDNDEGDDDIDSNASMSVDFSSVEGGIDEGKDKVMKTLQRLESKLDQLDEKIPLGGAAAETTVPSPSTVFAQPDTLTASRERSTNARHSREIVVNTDSIEESIRAEHSKLKQWIMEQQDNELNNSGRSESGAGQRVGTLPSENNPAAMATITTTIDPEQLQAVLEKLNAIETLVSTNQSFLQEQPRQAVPPVPKELPLVHPLGAGPGTLDMERKMLSHLNSMDKSVQFKLDEIYSQVQLNVKRRDSDFSTLSELDGQPAVIQAIEAQLQRVQQAITTQLKESIPDYGMANSLISEHLEDIRQIVSEVAISEVELLKTQLGVAEEAEQEALHALVVMREQMDEVKIEERRAAPQPSSQAAKEEPGGLWNFGPFGQLLGQQLRAPNQLKNPSMSIGQQSNGSAFSLGGSASRLTYNATAMPSQINKKRTPNQKLEDWKNQISELDEKGEALRTMYQKIRLQTLEDAAASAASGPVKSSLKADGHNSAGETKEMEVEIAVSEDEVGDWI